MAASVGFVWSHLYALNAAPPILDFAGTRLGLEVEGLIAGLPETRGGVTRFVLETPLVSIGDRRLPGYWRFRLNWRDAPPLTPGERWRLPVRLRAVHGYASPGAWDYEGWLYHQGIRYAGYVTERGAPRRLAAGGPTIDRLRVGRSEGSSHPHRSSRTVGVRKGMARRRLAGSPRKSRLSGEKKVAEGEGFEPPDP